MATWLAVLPAVSAMPPPRLQSVSRKRVGAMSSPNRMAPGGLASSPPSVSAAQHLAADVLQVGGAGAEILVVGNLVADDLGIDRIDPGIVGGHAFGDRREGRFGQRLVLQHGELEFEDRRALLADAVAIRLPMRAVALRDRRAQRLGLRMRIASGEILGLWPVQGNSGPAA